jgi:methylthioribulose-1-phosphate dehydratase
VTPFPTLARELCALARDAHARGSVAATSGNFSAVVTREPLRIAITPSGADKGTLAPEDVLEIDESGTVIGGATVGRGGAGVGRAGAAIGRGRAGIGRGGAGRPSAETRVHVAVIRARGAGAVAHTHSLWATLLSDGGVHDRDVKGVLEGGRSGGPGGGRGGGVQGGVDGRAPTGVDAGSGTWAGEVVLEGYEMLKALSGVTTHAHREVVPIVENTQDWDVGAREIESVLARVPGAHAFLIRRHGLYTWGRDVAEAGRHLAALEFLLEAHGRLRWRS